jgi:hypothetical protein
MEPLEAVRDLPEMALDDPVASPGANPFESGVTFFALKATMSL